MNKLLLIIMLQLGVTSLNAQNFKFGKVSVEELQEQFNPLDSTANATILYRKENIKYDFSPERGFVQMREIQERIKIYNKEGFDWATRRVELYAGAGLSKEELIDLKGYTYTLVNSKVEKEKLKKSGVFEEEINRYWKKKIFTMPNVNEGCVLEYKYIIRSTFLSIKDVNLQFSIPVKKLDFAVAIPEYFKFTKYLNPKAEYYPKLQERNRARVEKTTNANRSDDRAVQTTFSTSELNFNEVITEANLDNIPALKTEKFVRNLGLYRAKLQWEYVMFKSPNGLTKDYGTNWDRVTKNIYDNPDFGGEMKRTSFYSNDVKELLTGVSDPMEKAALIFGFVKSKVKWNGFVGYTPNNGLKKAYKNGEGNSGDINLLLVSMLKYAGINANPVLLSTKSHGVPLFATTKGFNYVVCGLELNDEVKFLDATRSYTTLDIIPEEALNWQGRIIRENGSSTWVNLFPKRNSLSTTMISVKLDDEFNLTGKLRSRETGYLAYNYRENFSGVVSEDLAKEFSKNYDEIEIENLIIGNNDDLSKPIMKTYDFNYENGVEEIGSEIYISPLLFLSKKENVFSQKERSYPIDFIYPRTSKIIINLTVPDGYAIKSVPKSMRVEMNEKYGGYSFLIKNNGNVVQITQELKINVPIIPVSHYLDLKGVYNKMTLKNAEKIVLEKI